MIKRLILFEILLSEFLKVQRLHRILCLSYACLISYFFNSKMLTKFLFELEKNSTRDYKSFLDSLNGHHWLRSIWWGKIQSADAVSFTTSILTLLTNRTYFFFSMWYFKISRYNFFKFGTREIFFFLTAHCKSSFEYKM